METLLAEKTCFEIFLFKSHYVVWKHLNEGEAITSHIALFKSHYVVWKLSFCIGFDANILV